MATSYNTFKQCSHKENCVQFGQCGWLPATTEYFNKKTKSKDGLGYLCKECNKAYLKRYYQEKPEVFAQYREENAEDIAAYKRKYRQEHPEETKRHKSESQKQNRVSANKRSLRFRQRHPEKVLEQREADRLRKLLNPEAERARRKRTKQKHPETQRSAVRRRRARLRGSVGNHTARDIKTQCVTQTDKRGRLCCWWCGDVIKAGKYHVDHRIPLSKGGSNAPENLCISCPYCNDSKGAKLPQEWNGRLL